MDAPTTGMVPPARPLVGRRVLVTGASSGIGAATARAIVAAGGSVALLARRGSVLDGLAHELAALGRPPGTDIAIVTPAADDAPPSTGATALPGDVAAAAGDVAPPRGDDAATGAAGPPSAREPIQRIAVVPADVVDADACRVAVDRAAQVLGGLDGLINAAGVLRTGSTLEGDPADWQLTFDVNVRGVLHATSAAAGHLRAAVGGERAVDVVNISSMSGRRLGTTAMAVYAASKAAVHMFSEGMRRELAADGIRLAVVSPGIVATGLFDTGGDGRTGDGSARDGRTVDAGGDGRTDAGRTGDGDDTTAMLARRAEEAGLDPQDVAAAIVGLLAAPAHVVHQEVALRHVGQ